MAKLLEIVELKKKYKVSSSICCVTNELVCNRNDCEFWFDSVSSHCKATKFVCIDHITLSS